MKRLPTLSTRLLLAIAILAGSPQPVAADNKPGDVMIDKYLAAETAKLSERFLDGARTLEEWQAKRPRLKQEYLDMLGLWPLPEKTPLHATVTGVVTVSAQPDNVVIEKLHFQSQPGLYVTGNLYRPKTINDKLPAVLYVCGHSGRGRDGNKTAFQDHGRWFATHGYICLMVDTLQLGEIPGIHHGTYREGRWWWQARGYTPAGVECWNGIRAIDYLVSRPDVDPDGLAVTGISGGGAATFWIAAADERVRCAVPVSGMSDLESYVTHKVINGHCDCMFLINTYQWEWTTIAALIAPRPLLFCNSDKDSIFPMDGNERIIARLRKLYAMHGKPDLVNAHVSHGGHDYRPDLRIAIFQWINKHLKNDTGPVEDARFTPIPGKELRVFPEDKDFPGDAINAKIDESFVTQAHLQLPETGKFPEWKKNLTQELRRRSFRALPDPILPAIPPKDHLAGATTETGIEIDAFGSDVSHRVKSEPRSMGLVLFLRPDDDGTLPKWSLPWLGSEAMGLAPRGVARAWTQKSPPNYVERAHALIGRTVDEGRLLDIIAFIRMENPTTVVDGGKKGWRIVARKTGGVIAAYAALFEPSIKELVIIDPPASHRDGPVFLNVLRVLDVPDALGMLAPEVSLTLVNARDRAFDRTAQLYKLAGAADKFHRK